MAIYGGQPPSDYYARQDARKDDKFRDIINLFLTFKQLKEQRSRYGEQQDLQERKFAQEQTEWPTQKGYMESITERNLAGPAPSNLEKEATFLVEKGVVPTVSEGLQYLENRGKTTPAEAEAIGYGNVKGQQRARIDYPTPRPKSERDKLKIDLDNLVAEGKITPEQRMASLYGIGVKEDVGDEDSKRNSNATGYARWQKETFDNANKMKGEAKKLYKRTGQPPTHDGFRLDMPQDYNLGLQNMRDGIATEYDRTTVAKYNAQFEAFQRLKEGIPVEGGLVKLEDFKQFMKFINDPRNEVDKSEWDRERVRIWYDIYDKKKEY